MRVFLLVLLCLALWSGGYLAGTFRGELRLQESLTESQAQVAEHVRLLERRLGERETEVLTSYVQGVEAGKARARDLGVDLSSGIERLRDAWTCSYGASTGVPVTAGGAVGIDEGARNREARAVRIVDAAAACDAQVRALQDVLRQERLVLGGENGGLEEME